MYSKLSSLIEDCLEYGLPEKSILEDKIEDIIGKQVSCSFVGDSVNIRIHVPSLFRSIAARYLDAIEIEKVLNQGGHKYKCKEVLNGVYIDIIDSPINIKKIQITV